MTSKYPRIGSVLVVALAAAIPAISATAGQAAKEGPTCKRAGSKTVAQNRAVRVYTVTHSDAKRLIACRRSTGRRATLFSNAGEELYTSSTFDSVRLRGYYVAWSSSTTDSSCKASCPDPNYNATTSSIRLHNVRTRRSRIVSDESPVSRALVVSNRGGVAWASHSAGMGPVEIRISVRAGDIRVLDRGRIDPRSLSIEIEIISWKRDGVERFARLR